MNHYSEAIAVGIVTTVVAWLAGIGAGRPTMAATPPAVSAEQRMDPGTLDPLPYKAAFDSAQAKLAKAQWQYEIAIRTRMRTADQLAAHRASREEFDASRAAVERASDTVRADRAALEEARVNLDHAKLIATLGQIKIARDLSPAAAGSHLNDYRRTAPRPT